MRQLYRYTFDASVDAADVEVSLLLAIFAAESLHGEARVRLEASHALDPETGDCVIDAGGEVGRDFNRLFVGFLRRELGEEVFHVQPVELDRGRVV